MSAGETNLTPLSADEAPRFDWRSEPPLQKIVAALGARRPGSARYVGGCVRDSLLGARPKDFDIATDLEPGEVVAALREAGLRAAPTGLEHGTVTAIADGVGVEVTTLRADISTDGRRATVAFTRDWDVDARRRDFRLNAIYLTQDGALFDPVGGVADAKSGRVRFIGEPDARIREDYLRILRFFRFSARFSGGFDAEGLGACAALKSGMKQLSAERIGAELSRILALPRAALAVDAMAAAGVLAQVWPAPPERRALSALKEASPDAPAPLALAALWGEAGEGIDAALRLSNADAARRRGALGAARAISAAMTEREARAALYRLGAERWRDGVLLAMARSHAASPEWDALARLPDRWTPPHFPFTGKDVIAAGVDKGPCVARILKAAEEAWIAEDFPDTERLRRILAEKAAANRS